MLGLRARDIPVMGLNVTIDDTRRNATYDWKLIETGPGEGDFNWDDAVNFEDFLVMAANFNTGTSFAQGDFNGDGVVDLVDFGEFYPLLPAPVAAASSVPEPASVSLLALGLVTVLSIRRRRNR